MKKIFIIFIRDIKVNTRDFLSLYILLAPVLFAIAINLIAPGVNDTTINIALVEGENPQMETYLKDFAKVSTYADQAALEERILRRDEVFGYIRDGDTYRIVRQGNEMDALVDYAKLMLVFYEEDVQIEDSTSTIHDFGRDVPPLKKLLTAIFMMFTSVLGGMIIAINIIEEKNDRTIRAIHLSPVSRNAFILGKSLMGAALAFIGSVVLLLIVGFTDINWGQMFVLILMSMVISILFGFIQGINNNSVMDAAGSVKMLFLPLAGAVAVDQLLSAKWQWTAYWVPFYWTYKGLDDVLGYKGQWGTILLYSGIVLGISALVYVLLMPRIRKGLE